MSCWFQERRQCWLSPPHAAGWDEEHLPLSPEDTRDVSEPHVDELSLVLWSLTTARWGWKLRLPPGSAEPTGGVIRSLTVSATREWDTSSLVNPIDTTSASASTGQGKEEQLSVQLCWCCSYRGLEHCWLPPTGEWMNSSLLLPPDITAGRTQDAACPTGHGAGVKISSHSVLLKPWLWWREVFHWYLDRIR